MREGTMRFGIGRAVLLWSFFAGTNLAAAQTIPAVTPDAPARRPAAIINLATEEGVRLVQGQWRYSDTKIIEVDHRGPGPDLRPSGVPNRTYNITPLAGAADFDR